ncbi:MAG: hypothetical protein GY869_30180, partial [Planctomycetes bacterium]|nr:hypothetical protein [Planctomycetota bacterium]
MATGPYNYAGRMFELLPTIYHRYDRTLSDSGAVPGQLRRFIDLPGGQFDQLYSWAKAMLELYNVDRVDGRLLPLLAQWIGWPSNFSLDYEAQCNEIRHAPRLYKTVGILANLRALVNRITNWDCQIKEFLHNIILSNDPEKLNTWSQKLVDGSWQPAELVSLDYAYDGR